MQLVLGQTHSANLLSGAVASAVAATLVTPADVIKTRLQVLHRSCTAAHCLTCTNDGIAAWPDVSSPPFVGDGGKGAARRGDEAPRPPKCQRRLVSGGYVHDMSKARAPLGSSSTRGVSPRSSEAPVLVRCRRN